MAGINRRLPRTLGVGFNADETASKPTNPKDMVGTSKIPLHIMPVHVKAEICLALGEGMLKYGYSNWRKAGVRASIYMAATQRHMDKWMTGEDIDPDSGLSHITKALASLTVLRDAMIHDMVEDDRPPKSRREWKEYDDDFALLLERYGHIKPNHITEKGLNDEAVSSDT